MVQGEAFNLAENFYQCIYYNKQPAATREDQLHDAVLDVRLDALSCLLALGPVHSESWGLG